jgi:hypothetical protein
MNIKGRAEEKLIEKSVDMETFNRDFTSINKAAENINNISNVT